MYKWIGITLAIIGLVWVGSMRSRWPEPSKGVICNVLPKFEDYSENIGGGKLATVDLDSNKMAKEEMEAELLAAVESAVNIAGKYVLVTHQCGLGCQKHAIVDTEGKIVFYGLQTSKDLEFRVGSRLVMTNVTGTNKSLYYEFKNKEMNYLCEKEKP